VGKKGGGSTQTTTQSADPWVGVQPALLNLYGNASNWFNSGGTRAIGGNNDLGTSAYNIRGIANNNLQPGQLEQMAKNNLQSVLGNEWTNNRYTDGSMLTGDPWAMGDALRNGDNAFASGKMLDNPYINQMVEASTRDVTKEFQNSIAPALMSQFSAAGRTGSGANVMAFGNAAGQLAERLGDMNANIRGNAYQQGLGMMSQAYEAERQRQYGAFQSERQNQYNAFQTELDRKMQASGMAPGLLSQDLARQNFGLQSNLALQNTGMYQRQIEQDLSNQQQNNLMAYSQLLAGAAPYASQQGTSSANQPYNRLTGTVGGGLAGAALASAMHLSGPIGAGLGALAGLFG
jgi:hypothetical protein